MPSLTLTAGTLPSPGNPPPGCYASEQARFNAYVASIIATLSTTGSVYVQPTAPTIDSQGIWVQTDASPATVIKGLYAVAGGAWKPIDPSQLYVGFSDSSVTVNQVQISGTPAFPSSYAYTTGDVWIVKVNLANSGPPTLKVGSLAAVNITIAGVSAPANALLAGYTYIFSYNGTNFELLNPNPQTQISTAFQKLKTYTYSSIPAVNAGTSVSLGAHGLGAQPTFLDMYWLCVNTGDGSFAVGQRVPWAAVGGVYTTGGFSFNVPGAAAYPISDATNCYIIFGKLGGGDAFSAYNAVHLGEGGGNGSVNLTPANWNLVITAGL